MAIKINSNATLAILYSLIIFVFSNENTDTVGYDGMVASPHFLATEAGIKILKQGGTAADAAVAVQMVLNVVHPSASGIGGGAFIVYYDSNTKEIYTIDGREEAPNAFNPYVFCANISCFNSNGMTGSCDNCDAIQWSERRVGGLSIGVPGTLYSFKKLWDTFGNIKWSKLFKDAINIANNGFIMYDELYNQIVDNIQYLSRYESTCKMILNYPQCNASKYKIGDIAIFNDFGSTLKILSIDANDAISNFYQGIIASAIVNASQNSINPITNRIGLMSMNDINGYKPVFRTPIKSEFKHNNNIYNIYGMNMPSSGPLTVQYALKMLQYSGDIENIYSADSLHKLFSAQNIAFSDRNEYEADQDFVHVPIKGLQDETYLFQRANDYLSSDIAQSLPIPYGYPTGYNDMEQSNTKEGGTAHISIVDKFGNIASITTTIEWIFGSFVVLDGYGFFLNNQLTDFSDVGIVNNKIVANGPQGGKQMRKSAINVFDYTDSQSIGGKRPRSSMSPVIVMKNNKPYLVAGSEGGSTIIGTTFGIVARSLIYGIGPQEAVNAPRIWGRNNGNVEFEIKRWKQKNSNIINELVTEKGYDETKLLQTNQGNANAIKIDCNNKMLYCGADYTRWTT
eukprot:491808_1